MNIGQKVKLNFGMRQGQVGEIVEIQPALKINGVVMSEKRHKVKWDSGDMSGWLKVTS